MGMETGVCNELVEVVGFSESDRGKFGVDAVSYTNC